MAKPISREPRQGDIYWVDDCSPLHGQVEKRRPVVILSPPQFIARKDQFLLIVAVSSSVMPSDSEAIPLPNKSTEPQTKTGLSKPCWAVPKWLIQIDRSRLIPANYAGFVSKKLLSKILEATLRYLQTPPK